jgi:hypothetical protein
VVERIANTAAVVCIALAAAAALWTLEAAVPLGVLGGGVLIGLSYWAIKGSVDALTARVGRPKTAPPEAGQGKQHLVKFFTRHGMLALAAYVMMVRLHLDPVGLLAGVSSLAIAVAVEVLRDLRWRRFP